MRRFRLVYAGGRCNWPRRSRRCWPAVDGLEERNLTTASGLDLNAAVLPQRHVVVSGVPSDPDHHHGANAAEPLAIMAAKRGRHGPVHRHGHRGAKGGNPNPGNPNPGNPNPGNPNPGNGGVQAQLLQGNWRTVYDPSATFGPGSSAVQEIVFTAPGPDGIGTFTATTGVTVPGIFAPSYYQFTSWGTWQQIDQTHIRMTITGASPTEYLDRGIIVMGGQFMEVNFINADQFSSSGNIYNRIPLGSSVFGP